MVEFAEQSKQSKKKDAIPKYNKEVIKNLVDAIIYEPTNELGLYLFRGWSVNPPNVFG